MTKIIKGTKNPVADAYEYWLNNDSHAVTFQQWMNQFNGCKIIMPKPLPKLFVVRAWRELIAEDCSEYLTVYQDDKLATDPCYVEIKIDEVE